MRLMMKTGLMMACVAVMFLLNGCGSEPPTRTADGKLKVATSVIPHGWLLKRIGGEHVDVAVAVTPGNDPHQYQPSDSEVSRLASSALYFKAGVPTENGGWFRAMTDQDWMTVIDLREGVDLMEMSHDHHDHHHSYHHGLDEVDSYGSDDHDDHKDHGHKDDDHKGHGHDHHDHHGHDHGDKFKGTDPHTWLSIPILIQQGEAVYKALAKADPSNAESYKANYESLKKELEELHVKLGEILADRKGKAFMIYHPAWGYFARDYGMKQLAIEIEGNSPSDQEITELIKKAKEYDIKTVFIQSQINHESAMRIADQINARVLTADPLAEDVPTNLLQIAHTMAKDE